MHIDRTPIIVVLLAAATFCCLHATGCSKADSADEYTPSASAPTSVLGAAGSTFVAPLMAKWTSEYQHEHPGVQINYRAIGSGGGIEEFKKGYLSFGASDAALTDDELQNTGSLVQIPVSAGPVCLIYNLPNLKAPLRFSSKALAGIYLGTIINWQDPAIARDNPGVSLPRAAVIVVHRSDGSGTTSIFSSYLAKTNRDWKAGHGLVVSWPIGLGVEGSKAVLAIVKQTPGTIGYLELNYAKENSMSVASVENQAGQFVQPSPASSAAAISAFQEELAKDVRTPIVDPPPSARDAYPISGLTFLLIHKDREANEQQAVKAFVAYVTSKGQDFSEQLSYARLPQPVQEQDAQLLSQLTANGQTLK